jgi:hypothetical protein
MTDAEHVALITAIPAIIAAGAVLISQLINGHYSLKAKKTELLYNRKVDSYQNLINLTAAFASDPTKHEMYLPFAHALDGAKIVASDKVNGLLDDLSSIAQRLRIAAEPENVAKEPGKFEGLRVKQWYDVMKTATNAMREDVGQVSG